MEGIYVGLSGVNKISRWDSILTIDAYKSVWIQKTDE